MAFEPSQLIPALLKNHSQSNETQIQGVRKMFQEHRLNERTADRADVEQKRKERQTDINQEQVDIQAATEARKSKELDLEQAQLERDRAALEAAFPENKAPKFTPSETEAAWIAGQDPRQAGGGTATPEDQTRAEVAERQTDNWRKGVINKNHAATGQPSSIDAQIQRLTKLSTNPAISKDLRDTLTKQLNAMRQLKTANATAQREWFVEGEGLQQQMRVLASHDPAGYMRLRQMLMAESPQIAALYPENPATYAEIEQHEETMMATPVGKGQFVTGPNGKLYYQQDLDNGSITLIPSQFAPYEKGVNKTLSLSKQMNDMLWSAGITTKAERDALPLEVRTKVHLAIRKAKELEELEGNVRDMTLTTYQNLKRNFTKEYNELQNEVKGMLKEHTKKQGQAGAYTPAAEANIPSQINDKEYHNSIDASLKDITMDNSVRTKLKQEMIKLAHMWNSLDPTLREEHINQLNTKVFATGHTTATFDRWVRAMVNQYKSQQEK
jgi:hypothetical protein